MVEERLAACIKSSARAAPFIVGKARSRQQRSPAILKTTSALADALVARIAALHSYALPCVTVWPIDKLLSSYADWVEGSTASG